ncbi:MAG: hypothetical protein AAFX78_04405 [Cyanobacteria bacterium J06638_20]
MYDHSFSSLLAQGLTFSLSIAVADMASGGAIAPPAATHPCASQRDETFNR